MRLFGIIYALTGPTLAGILVIVALVLGMVDARSIIVATAVGALLGLPAAWVIARQIADR
jgi:hypothetical protein